MLDPTYVRLAVALGIGLMLGLERERSKAPGEVATAGIRTFALLSLLGGLAMVLESTALLVVAGLFVTGVAVVGYVRSARTDPGLTTEVAMMMAYLLGALAQRSPALAASVGVGATALLALRDPIHVLARQKLTETEVLDGLLLAVAALVVLPLVPDRAVDPFGVLNPFRVWRLVVVVMSIHAAGYVALRVLGPRLGLPVAGLAAGFVSSTATIGTMGSRAVGHPAVQHPAVAGAVLSTVSTVVQLVLVVGATSRSTLRELWSSLGLAGVVAVGYGVVFALRAARGEAPESIELGHPVDFKSALAFALVVSAMTLFSAALHAWLGGTGLLVAAAVAGFADAHAPAISTASLVESGRLRASNAVIPILAAMTTNTVTKGVIAFITGPRRFAIEVSVGIVLVIVAAWVGLMIPTAMR